MHPLAAEAGLEMLEKGGNAVDAAVATGFAISVVEPNNSSIAGVGFMLVHLGAAAGPYTPGTDLVTGSSMDGLQKYVGSRGVFLPQGFPPKYIPDPSAASRAPTGLCSGTWPRC